MNLPKRKIVLKYMAIFLVLCSCMLLYYTFATWALSDDAAQQMSDTALVGCGAVSGLMLFLAAGFWRMCADISRESLGIWFLDSFVDLITDLVVDMIDSVTNIFDD